MELTEDQRAGVELIRRGGGCMLAFAMGTGKSATVLSAIQVTDLPVLVVAPKRVAAETWAAEVAIWRPDLSVGVAVGTPKQRAAVIAGDHDILVIGRDVADSVMEDTRFRTRVLDELSGYKSPSSKRFKAARKFRGRTIGLTGTPGNLMDLWAQVFLLDGGARLGRSITAYRRRWFRPGFTLPSGVVTSWEPVEGAQEEIEALVSEVSLSAVGQDFGTVTTVHPVVLPGDVAAIYAELKRELVVELGGTAVTAASAAVVSGKLSQISAGFIYDEEKQATELHDLKVAKVAEIVASSDSNCLIFYRFTHERDMLLEAVDGAVADPGRDLSARWNAGEFKALVLHPAAAGHGLNLQFGGHVTVWSSLPWSLELWQQANARLARRGQSRVPEVHIVEAVGTVDARVLRVLQGKSTAQESLLAELRGA